MKIFKKEANETNLNFMIFSFHHQTHYSTAIECLKINLFLVTELKCLDLNVINMNTLLQKISKMYLKQQKNNMAALLIHIIHICNFFLRQVLWVFYPFFGFHSNML